MPPLLLLDKVSRAEPAGQPTEVVSAMNRSGCAISSSIAQRSSSNRARRSTKFRDFGGTCRFGGRRPASDTLHRGRGGVQGGDVTAAAGHKQEQRTPLGVALPDHRAEVARSGRAPKDAGDFEVRREGARSGGVPLVGADQDRGEGIAATRAAHLLERAAWRVTRLIAASAFRCSAPASGGESRRKTRSTGPPSIAL